MSLTGSHPRALQPITMWRRSSPGSDGSSSTSSALSSCLKGTRDSIRRPKKVSVSWGAVDTHFVEVSFIAFPPSIPSPHETLFAREPALGSHLIPSLPVQSPRRPSFRYQRRRHRSGRRRRRPKGGSARRLCCRCGIRRRRRRRSGHARCGPSASRSSSTRCESG